MSDSANFPLDPYAGGRFFNAISESNLPPNQKFVLLTIASQLSFREPTKSKRYMSIEQICKWTSLSRRAVQYCTKELHSLGYLDIENRFDEGSNRQQSNLYSMSPKVFIEYVNSTEGAPRARGRVHHVHPNLPNKELPQENTILGLPNIVCADAHAPNQNNEVPNDEIIEEVKIKPEAKKRKAKATKYTRPPVTQSHQKMARIFTPRPELKSFVHRNDILFAVDELIEEFGEVCHNVIEYLYQWAKKNDKCGTIRWTPSVVRDLFLIAQRKMQNE